MAKIFDKLGINHGSTPAANRGPVWVNRSLALVVLLSVTLLFTVLMLSSCGDDKEATQQPAENTATQETAQTPAADSNASGFDLSDDDSLMAMLQGEDPSVIQSIKANLAILDYKPSDADIYGDAATDPGMSKEDSTKAVKWIDAEKKRLADKEHELSKREKNLNALDNKISKKILRIEQAESARIAQLARLYDGMDARAVAKLAANLDDTTVVAILPRMKPKNAALVLQMMPATRAARLSKEMITIADK